MRFLRKDVYRSRMVLFSENKMRYYVTAPQVSYVGGL